MKNPSILALAKCIPAHTLSQTEIADQLSSLAQLTPNKKELLKKIYLQSAITRRYSVLPDLLYPKVKPIGMSERNNIYKKEAPLLAEEVAKLVIEEWQGSLKEITHVISVSCTGIISPGLEIILARKLGLNPHTSLVGINQMGCFGSFKALKLATKIAKDNPKNRILIVDIELCSLHLKPPDTLEAMVIHSLFGDGAAAVIIGMDPKKKEKALFELTDEASYLIQETEKHITWDASDTGFDMTLSAAVPDLIKKSIKPFMNHFLGKETRLNAWEWAIHPGGKAIVEAIEVSLKLDKSVTSSSWSILNQYGNLSSVTFLYILDEISRRTSKKKIIGLGFGPGVVIEALSLKKL